MNKKEPFRIVFEKTPDDLWYVCRLKQRMGIPGLFNVLCDESLYHMRGALDHLVCGLLPVGQAPTNSHSFPCYQFVPRSGPVDGMVSGAATKGIPTDARLIVEALQPYYGTEPSHELLAGLDKMGNLFKHQSPSQLSAEVRYPDLDGLIRAPFGKTLNHGDVIAHLPIAFDPQEDFAKHTQIAIAFRWEGWGPADLRTIYDFIRNGVIPSFARFFPQS